MALQKVQLFIPCFIDQLYPDTAFNTIKILEKVGCEVQYNPEQTCCGQPMFNAGHWDDAKTLAVKFLNDFEPNQIIVSPSASCTAYVKNHYHKLLENETEQLQRLDTMRPMIFELSDFLVNVLKVTDLHAVFPHKVTFHDACHALREYKLTNESRILLQNVKGLELIEMENTDTCCGFGGTFSMKFPSISSAMAEQKVEWALQTGAEYIVSTEASCLMNVQGYISKQNKPIKTIHLADVLASGL